MIDHLPFFFLELLRLDLVRGPATAALIVVDEPEVVRQTIQIRQQILVIEVWPTVQDDDRLPVTDVARSRAFYATCSGSARCARSSRGAAMMSARILPIADGATTARTSRRSMRCGPRTVTAGC